MNILDAMIDPRLFSAQFGGPTWAAWRALLGGFYGVAGIDRDLFHGLTRREPGTPFQELWLAIGRRGGKSQAAALIAVFEAAFRDHRAKLAPGEVATVLVVAADRRQARVVHRYVRGLIDANPMLRRMVTRETGEIIELSNGSAIEIATASFRALRGYTVAAAILDEVAFWHSDGANPDRETIAALRPALATLNGKLIALSSPYARRGVLWDAYRTHFGGDSKRVLVAQAPSRRMNPTLPEDIVREALRADASSARAEWMAEFRADIEDFVRIETLVACTDIGLRQRPPAPGVPYVAFVDPSGGSVDSMSVAIAHRKGEVAFLDAILEIKAPFSPDDAVARIAEVLKTYKVRAVRGDRYAGEWPKEVFGRHGITYLPAEKPKSDLYRDLLPMLNSGAVRLLDDDLLMAQLNGLERRTSRGGRDLIDHPPNGHDDVANAVAGALLATVRRRSAAPVAIPVVGLI